MDAIFLKLLNMSFAAGWMILAVIVLRLLLKKAPKFISCILWAIVAVRLICPLSFESVFSLLPSGETIPHTLIDGNSFVIDTGVDLIDSPVNEYLGDRYYEGVTVPADMGSNVMSVLGAVWLIGMCVMLIYAAVSYFRLNRHLAPAILLRENIYICDNVRSPFIIGIFRPRIFLPSEMDDDSMRHVIAHEKAHISRHDHIWKPLGFLLLSVYWFHPLVWVGYILLCRDIELACDEKAVKDLTLDEKKAYSCVLLECSVSHRPFTACPLAFGEVGVKNRVKNVLNYKKPSFWLILIAVLACIVLAVGFLTTPSSLRIEKHDWTFSNVLTKDGVIFCSEELEYIWNAEVTSLTLSVNENTLVLEHPETQNSWEFGYKLDSVSPSTTLYTITLGDSSGYAVVGETKRYDDDFADSMVIVGNNDISFSLPANEMTLILSIDGYSIYFYEDISTSNKGSRANKEDLQDVDDISGAKKYTGFFLKTESDCFFISDRDNDTFYKGEPVKISAPSWDKDTTVNFDSFSNGDKIAVEIYQIGDTEPRDMPVYGVELIEEGTISDISNDVIQYLAELGYKVADDN